MEPRTVAPGLKPAKPLVSTALPRKLPGIDHYLDSDLRAQLARKYGDLSKKGNAAAPRIQQTAQFVAVASTRLPAPPLGFGGARLGATQPARGGGGRPAARSIDDADYVTRREFETRLKMMDDKLQLLAVALRQREAQHEDLELQVRELAARLPMPGANFGGAPGRASHHQSPRHMPWQPGGGAGEPEYYDGDAALVHADGDLDDEEGGAFDEVGGDEQPIGEAGIVSVPPGSGGMVQIDLENEYSNPVVVASLVPGSFCPSPVAGQSWQSAVEPDARTTVCVPFADGSSFTIQLYGGGGDGPGDDDERHVAYVVVEAGTHTLASGGTLIAGQALVPPGRPEPLSFEAPFARPPSVLCTLMQSTAVDDDTMIRASCGLVDPAGCSLAADLVAARPDGSPPPRPGQGAAPTLSLPPSPPPSPPEGEADGEAPPPAEAPAAEAEAEAAAPPAEAEAEAEAEGGGAAGGSGGGGGAGGSGGAGGRGVRRRRPSPRRPSRCRGRCRKRRPTTRSPPPTTRRRRRRRRASCRRCPSAGWCARRRARCRTRRRGAATRRSSSRTSRPTARSAPTACCRACSSSTTARASSRSAPSIPSPSSCAG